ncbi:right-handed parallel beta-helix repeat-containing protein [Treponema succinifaciens]|uniref:right-handed parallel beta-helix repeat-containing protein n=1 Tax=Treponema succinifaciens TaxID=167 RepID=UPI0023F44F35|nr:right-handed parallel beta-helix repeat-containing protein [Treponema succinifaciens]
MKKFAFSILPALLLAFVSCMNMSSGSEGGSVRVVLPSSSRTLYSSGHGDVDSFTVRLLLGEKIIKEETINTETDETGGVIVFDELEPATYTVEVEGWMSSKDVLLYFGTEEAKVTAGQDSDCQVNLKKKDCQIYNISADARELKTACESDGNAYIFMGADSSVSTNQATPENNCQLTNITSGTKIIRGNGGKLVQSTDDNKTLTTEGGQIKLFNVTGSSTILEINNLTFTASDTVETSALDGALICVDDGATVILKQCRMNGISMSNLGTSLIYVKSGGKLLVENCTFYNNTSTNKGSASFSECIRIENGAQVEVVSCNFETNGNDIMSNAAAIENSGSCRITNTTFKDNLAQRGGAIMNNETGILEIESSTFDSNTCTSSGYYAMRGGAIFIQGGTVKIKDSTFTGNETLGQNASEGTANGEFQKLGGGAISLKMGSLTLQNTRFDNNSVTSTSKNDAYGYGGAVLIEQSDASLFLKDASGAAMDIASYINKYMSGNTTAKTDAGANIYCNGGTINGTVYTKAWE